MFNYDTKRGRPMAYAGILGALGPDWCYSAAGIAEFAAAVGLLTLVSPNDISAKKRRERLRIALGRRRAAKGFPLQGDATVFRSGRLYPAWAGWRWQNFQDAQSASERYQKTMFDFWRSLDTEKHYNLQDLIDCWLKLPPSDGELDPYQKDRLHKGLAIRKTQVTILLQRHCFNQGLSPEERYRLSVWSTPKTIVQDQNTTLRPLAMGLLPQEFYSPVDMVHLGILRKIVPNPTREEITRLRAALFRIARKNYFPEHGDSRSSQGGGIPVPAWLGRRWMNALGVSWFDRF